MGDRKIGINVDGDGNVIRENTIIVEPQKPPDRTSDEPPNNLESRGIDRDRRAALTEPAILRKTNEFGRHYNLKFWLETNTGSSLILTAWIIRTDEDFPRLTNCYPVDK